MSIPYATECARMLNQPTRELRPLLTMPDTGKFEALRVRGIVGGVSFGFDKPGQFQPVHLSVFRIQLAKEVAWLFAMSSRAVSATYEEGDKLCVYAKDV